MNQENEVIENLIYKIGKAGKIKSEDLGKVGKLIRDYLIVMSETSSIAKEITREHKYYYQAKDQNTKVRISHITKKFTELQNPYTIETNWEEPYEFCTRSTLIVLKTDDLL